MVLIEFKEAAINKAFESFDEAKQHFKKGKLAMCELESALYDIYDAHKESEEEREEEYESPEENYDIDMGDVEVNYRGRRNMRRGMRYGYRSSMNRRRSGRYSY